MTDQQFDFYFKPESNSPALMINKDHTHFFVGTINNLSKIIPRVLDFDFIDPFTKDVLNSSIDISKKRPSLQDGISIISKDIIKDSHPEIEALIKSKIMFSSIYIAKNNNDNTHFEWLENLRETFKIIYKMDHSERIFKFYKLFATKVLEHSDEKVQESTYESLPDSDHKSLIEYYEKTTLESLEKSSNFSFPLLTTIIHTFAKYENYDNPTQLITFKLSSYHNMFNFFAFILPVAYYILKPKLNSNVEDIREDMHFTQNCVDLVYYLYNIEESDKLDVDKIHVAVNNIRTSWNTIERPVDIEDLIDVFVAKGGIQEKIAKAGKDQSEDDDDSDDDYDEESKLEKKSLKSSVSQGSYLINMISSAPSKIINKIHPSHTTTKQEPTNES